jgi:SRSO17 transposase
LRRARWDADDLREYLVGHLGDCVEVLIVDETGFLKKGVRSAGVQRQYSALPVGRQLPDRHVPGVCLHPRPGTDRPGAVHARLLDRGRDRCRAAGVPEGTEFETKPQQAKAMIDRAIAAGCCPATTLSQLITTSASRWQVEECFQAARDEAGLDHCRSRRYDVWYAPCHGVDARPRLPGRHRHVLGYRRH